MFLHLCVILFTERVGFLACITSHMTRSGGGGLHPGGCIWGMGVGQTPPSPELGKRGGTHATGMLSCSSSFHGNNFSRQVPSDGSSFGVDWELVDPRLIAVKKFFITTRKRSLRRLCFYTCESFCSQGGGVSASVHTGIHPPGSRHSPKQASPGADPPGADTPPCAVHAGRYGQQAGGTHPTGMHTYFSILFFSHLRKHGGGRRNTNKLRSKCLFPSV